MEDLSTWVAGVLYPVIAALVGWIRSIQNKGISDREDLKDKIQALELKLASGYHDKTEFEQILNKALEPLKDTLREIKTQLGARNGANNGH